MSQWRIATKQWTKFFFSMITRLLPLNMVRALFESSMEALHRRGPDFITHRTLSKSGEKGPYHVLDPILPMPHEPIGLVLQGPLLLQDDFTVESVRYYSRVKPQVIVIVSTWEGEDAAALERIKVLGAEIVINKKPHCPGRSNVNYQVASTRGGIERAIQLGCQHVAKTRTDQRIYSIPTLLSLSRILFDYPVRNSPSRQRQRIITTSRGTSKYGPYHFSDFFIYGEINDMLEFWSPPLDYENYHHISNKLLVAKSYYEEVLMNPEHYIICNYLLRDLSALDYTVCTWWNILADRFCVIDWKTLDVYWPKYEPNSERPDLAVDHHAVMHSMRFIDWLILHNSPQNCSYNGPDDILAFYQHDNFLNHRGHNVKRKITNDFKK